MPNTSTKKYVKPKSIEVHVVEFHNEALTHIYRGIGAKLLPYDDLALVHFDSHPDLGIPPNLKAADVYDKNVLFELLEIESWILPAVFSGHINFIVWLKPVWATQIPEGKHSFKIGKHPCNGKIRVSCTLPYFLSDCLFVEEDVLEDEKTFDIIVITVDVSQNRKILLTDILRNDQAYILDIDLDFFSTCNPFQEMFSKQDLATLTELYWFQQPLSDNVENINSCQHHRDEQLQNLRDWLVLIRNEESCSDERFMKLKNVVKNYESSCDRKMDDEDVEILHGAGCATDDPGLPHHVSSKKEIIDLMHAVESILSSADRPPSMVTIARSTEDGYCPPNQVDDIQNRCEDMMRSLYDSVSCRRHYESD